MAAYDDDQGPYRGYQPRAFDSGNLSPPVRVAAPPTSTFDRAPVRGVAPIHSEPPTSVFDKPPVKGAAPGAWESGPPLTSEFDEPPLRSRFDAVAADDFNRAPPGREAGGGQVGSGQSPMIDNRSPGGKAMAGGKATDVTELVLRAVASLFLIIALALFARFVSDLREYTIGVSVDSPTYALIVAIIGLLYSLFQLTMAIFHLTMGKRILPTRVSHYISYIGDQALMGFTLSAGSAAASYLVPLDCTAIPGCDIGAAGTAMEFLAFVFITINSFLSTFSFYRNRI